MQRRRLGYVVAVTVLGAVVAALLTARLKSARDAAIVLAYIAAYANLAGLAATAAANNPGFYPASGAGPWLRVGQYFMFLPLVILAAAAAAAAGWLL